MRIEDFYHKQPVDAHCVAEFLALVEKSDYDELVLDLEFDYLDSAYLVTLVRGVFSRRKELTQWEHVRSEVFSQLKARGLNAEQILKGCMPEAEIRRLDQVVDEFTKHMKARLAEKCETGLTGWDSDNPSSSSLAKKLLLRARFLQQNDSAKVAMDIACFAMFLWYRFKKLKEVQ